MVNLFETKHGGFERNHTLLAPEKLPGPNRKPDLFATSNPSFFRGYVLAVKLRVGRYHLRIHRRIQLGFGENSRCVIFRIHHINYIQTTYKLKEITYTVIVCVHI